MKTEPDTQNQSEDSTTIAIPAVTSEVTNQIKSLEEAVGGLTKIVENLQGDIVSKVYELGVKDGGTPPPQDSGNDPTAELRAEIEGLKTQLTQKDLKSSILEAASTHHLHSTHLLAHVLTQCDIESTSDGTFNLSRGGKSLGSLEKYVGEYARSEEGKVISLNTPPTPTGAGQSGDAPSRTLTSMDLLKTMYPHLS